MNKITQTLGANIAHRRRAARISQTDLAQRAAVSRATISNIERACYDPTLSTIERIANALNVTVVKLLAPQKASQITQKEDTHV